MSKIIVNISRAYIYHIAEGISVTISQHNGGTPTFEQLWASPDEAKKLDIYYREAINDLERSLTKWIYESSGQFDLTQDGTDYTLQLRMNMHWPDNLQGLLRNKVQDYLVHAVTAGWLNDFAGLDIKQDFKAIATQDLSDIRSIIYERRYAFDTSYRNEDGTNKHSDDEMPPYCGDKYLRHRDNDIVDTRSDYTDWSGTGIAFRRGKGCPPPPFTKDPRIPDNLTHPNYPHFHCDGVDWTDKDLYNEEASNQYVNGDVGQETIPSGLPNMTDSFERDDYHDTPEGMFEPNNQP
jgi:hypothetical protein